MVGEGPSLWPVMRPLGGRVVSFWPLWGQQADQKQGRRSFGCLALHASRPAQSWKQEMQAVGMLGACNLLAHSIPWGCLKPSLCAAVQARQCALAALLAGLA